MKLSKYVLPFFLVNCFLYLLVSFITMNFNLFDWFIFNQSVGRFLFVLTELLIAILVYFYCEMDSLDDSA